MPLWYACAFAVARVDDERVVKVPNIAKFIPWFWKVFLLAIDPFPKRDSFHLVKLSFFKSSSAKLYPSSSFLCAKGFTFNKVVKVSTAFFIAFSKKSFWLSILNFFISSSRFAKSKYILKSSNSGVSSPSFLLLEDTSCLTNLFGRGWVSS